MTPATCDDANPICWKKLTGKDNKNDVAELLSIPQTDDKGNTTTIKKWVAKQDTIRHLIEERQKFNEALSLQNKRNMVLALQGDSQAIQKAQAETMMMLSRQINTLNNGINQLGILSAEFLNQRLDEQEKNQKNYIEKQKLEDKLKKVP